MQLEPIEVVRVVPAGVPVASIGGAYYSGLNVSQAPFLTDNQLSDLIDRLAELLSKRRNPPSIVSQACAKCHSGPEPKGDFSIPNNPSPDIRLQMIARILSTDVTERMPKGKVLDPSELSSILRELSSEGKVDPAPTKEKQK